MSNFFYNLKSKAKDLKNEVKALYLAYKRPDVSWYAKLIAAITVGYALSPIDLVPDFIPILGYLDDIILIPLLVYLTLKLIPKSIMNECRIQAEQIFKTGKPKNWISGILIILIWILISAIIFTKMVGLWIR